MRTVIIPVDGNHVVEFTRIVSGAWEIRKYTLPNRPDKPDYRLPTRVFKAMGILLLSQNIDPTFRALLWQGAGVRKRDCKVEQ